MGKDKNGVMRNYTHACGCCMPCRVTKRQAWTLRIELEAMLYADNCFCTLTYDDDHLPVNGSINKRDLQLFVKRLRKNLKRKLRYFGVGEYGDEKGRAHYHLILFNVSQFDLDTIQKSWDKGRIQVSNLTIERSSYCAKYTTKKLGGVKSRKVTEGREDEFSLQSKVPALGSWIVEKLAISLKRNEKRIYDTDMELNMDFVPTTLRLKGRLLPIDNTIRKKLIDALDIPLPELKKRLKEYEKSIQEIDYEAETQAIKQSKRKAEKMVRRSRGKL